MSKRTGLSAIKVAAEAKGRESDETDPSRMHTTAIHIPYRTWELLRDLAFCRAKRTGNRASVSRTIAELVEASRAQINNEIR